MFSYLPLKRRFDLLGWTLERNLQNLVVRFWHTDQNLYQPNYQTYLLFILLYDAESSFLDSKQTSRNYLYKIDLIDKIIQFTQILNVSPYSPRLYPRPIQHMYLLSYFSLN